MSAFLKIALFPPPKPERLDTSLRYTDILFGFVIRELFIRIQNQNWWELDGVVQLHLIVGAILVLGSWIGFRRSLNRSGYQVKFFNLPLFRFIVDQIMLILYFRIAVLTDQGGKPAVADLPEQTARFVMYVFFLYVVWDLLGIWIAEAKKREGAKTTPLYPVVANDVMTEDKQAANWLGLWISMFGFAFTLTFWLLAGSLGPRPLLILTAALLLAYRFFKEIRTSCKP
jgi:hypothetical protein